MCLNQLDAARRSTRPGGFRQVFSQGQGRNRDVGEAAAQGRTRECSQRAERRADGRIAVVVTKVTRRVGILRRHRTIRLASQAGVNCSRSSSGCCGTSTQPGGPRQLLRAAIWNTATVSPTSESVRSAKSKVGQAPSTTRSTPRVVQIRRRHPDHQHHEKWWSLTTNDLLVVETCESYYDAPAIAELSNAASK